MTKELWIEAYEELVVEYMDEGLSETEAEAKAAENAGYYMFDRVCDLAEALREREG